jgi:hypothetical protein
MLNWQISPSFRIFLWTFQHFVTGQMGRERDWTLTTCQLAKKSGFNETNWCTQDSQIVSQCQGMKNEIMIGHFELLDSIGTH